MAPTSCPAPVPPNGSYAGHDYGYWSTLWWRLVIEQTNFATDSAVVDGTGAHCMNSQPPSDVWFLFGSFGTGTTERSCTVPHGRALFFPLINNEYDNGGVPMSSWQTRDELLASSRASQATYTMLVAEVDGCPLSGLSGYDRGGDEFMYTVPPSPNAYDYFGAPFTGPVNPAFASGVWILLPPLPPGAHTIHFGAHATNPMGPDTVQDITYHLTIQ